MRRTTLAAATLMLFPLLALQAQGQWVLKLEPNHSTVGFSVPIVGGMTTVTGNFRDFDVEIIYDEEDISLSAVKARIKAYSVDTGIDMRDRDLRGPEFFDVDSYPEITFQSQRVEKRGDNLVAVGDLTLRGVTKQIELPFTVTNVDWDESEGEKRPAMGIAATTKLNRHDFGVGSGWQHSAIPNFVGDEVTVQIFMWTRSGEKAETSAQD